MQLTHFVAIIMEILSSLCRLPTRVGTRTSQAVLPLLKARAAQQHEQAPVCTEGALESLHYVCACRSRCQGNTYRKPLLRRVSRLPNVCVPRACRWMVSLLPSSQSAHVSAPQVLEAMDFYEVLGVAWSDVNPKTVKAARKARALAVHPDKVSTPGADLAGSRLNAAYDTLSSSQARKEYDAWLSRQS